MVQSLNVENEEKVTKLHRQQWRWKLWAEVGAVGNGFLKTRFTLYLPLSRREKEYCVWP